jgi:hypothetical protein
LAQFAITKVVWDVEIADVFTGAYWQVSLLVAFGCGQSGSVIVKYNAESHRRPLFRTRLGLIASMVSGAGGGVCRLDDTTRVDVPTLRSATTGDEAAQFRRWTSIRCKAGGLSHQWRQSVRCFH